MKEKYEKKIKLEKELIDAQPINNLKNINKKLELLDNLKNEYTSQINKIKLKLEQFISKFDTIKINSNIEVVEKKVNKDQSNIYLLNSFNTPFEKLELDKICYNIRNYKNNNLEYINKNIFDMLNIFKEVGIDLNSNDFNYSIFFKEYITELLNNKNIDELNTLFEQLYWQSPNIINHIEMNIKYLYLKNIKKFNKFISKKQNEVNDSITNLYEIYRNDKIKYLTLSDEDIYLNFEKFKNKELKINDYNEEKIIKLKNELSEGNPSELNFRNLLEDIIEYKNYEKFKFILDEVKIIFNERNKYKNAYKLKLKEIVKLEKKLYKLNNKYNKTKKEELKININSTLDTLYNLYIELENNKFNETIYKYLFDNSNICKALEVASSYYIFICNCIKKSDLDVDIDIFVKELKEFVLDPSNSIVNTVNIIDNYDFPSLICEKNRLMRMLISPELLDENNIKNLIDKLKIIIKSYDLQKIEMSIEEIDMYINVMNVLSKN